MKEMAIKNRGAKSRAIIYNQVNPKMNNQKAIDLRQKFFNGKMSKRALAREFNISATMVSLILNNKKWIQ